MKHNVLRRIICMMLTLIITANLLPKISLAAWEYTWTEEWHWEGTIEEWVGCDSNGGSYSTGTGKSSPYKYDMATTIEKMIEICKKYSYRSVTTGVRNQINWMKQLYAAAVKDFVAGLDLGDTLLLALLNHENISKILTSSSYSFGDINREVARMILDGMEGYTDVAAIAKATGLKEKDVRSIMERIAAGGITEKTIAVGKNRTRASTHGVYVNTQALKQDKVYKYLAAEVGRMVSDPDALMQLYQDLGTGYVDSMLSGQELNKYQIELYKKNLAATLDSIADSDDAWALTDYDITKGGAYKVTKKTRSALSKLYSYEIGGAQENLSDEMKAFLEKNLNKNTLSEAEAKEFLILCGEYEEGDHNLTEATKQLLAGHKHLQKFEKTLKTTGKVFDVVDEVKKAGELIDYWADDYAEQELMLDHLVETLSEGDADMELIVAAQELQLEYNNKMNGVFDRVYTTLIDKGIGSVKSAFPPLGIAEAAISLTGTLTGADDHVDALETGFAMQIICGQALDNYEAAVIAVNQGDTSSEALSEVLSTFAVARYSLASFYEAMIELAEDEEQKQIYTKELDRLQEITFGYVTVPTVGS